jgi:hypothetical protein
VELPLITTCPPKDNHWKLAKAAKGKAAALGGYSPPDRAWAGGQIGFFASMSLHGTATSPVMARAEHLKASGLSIGDVEALLEAVAAVAEPVRLAYLWRPTLPDVDDDMVLEAAVNGRADGIVPFNLSDFIGSAKQFGIEVVRPDEATQRLEEKPWEKVILRCDFSHHSSRRRAS